MPQCQRSPNHTLLPEAFELSPGVIRCPGAPYSTECPGGELYVALSSGELVEYLAESLKSCAREFGVDLDDEPTALWLGHDPLTVEHDGRYSVYLNQGLLVVWG